MLRTIQQILGLALAYFVAGKLATLLIIPPSHATTIWPPAGIALGAALVFGYRIIPGALLGAFLVNWSGNGFTTPIPSLFIGLGVGLQTAIALYLCRLFKLHKSAFESGHEIIKLFLVGGALSGLVNAVIGSYNLRLFNVTPHDQILATGFTWWAGDFSGVLIFAPLTLILIGLPRDVWRPRLVQVGIPIVIAFTASLFLFVFASRGEQDKRHIQFESRVTVHEFSIKEAVRSYQEIIQNMLNFYRASETVTRDEFHEFTKATLKNYPGIQALEWVPVIDHYERPALEQSARKDGFPDFRITDLVDDSLQPSSPQHIYYPILFVEPLAGNEEVVGFNLGSHSQRLTAIRKASRENTMVATEPLALLQDEENGPGILVFLPVLEGTDLQGLVLGVFRVSSVLGNLPESLATEGISMSLHDASLPGEQGRLFGSLKTDDGGFVSRRQLKVADRTWEITFHRSQAYLQANQTWQAWSLFTAGVIINALLVGFLLILSGRTSRVKLLVEERTRDLDAARKEAMKSAEVKAAFLANMSHEIRTPMNGIVGMINLAAEEEVSPEVARMLKTAKSSADSLLVIINDILDFSKLEAGQIQLEQEPFSIAALTENIKSLFLPQAGEKDLTLRTEFGVGIPDWVDGDATRIGQVLANLTSNAVKFTEAGEVVLNVHLEDREGEWVTCFAVRDTGIGLSNEDVDKLFVPFSQVDGSAARRFGGTGLGLAICRRLVKQMGGELSVESKKDRGSNFSFALPLPESTSPPKEDETQLGAGPELGARHPLHILIAEDSHVNQVIANSFLKKLGYVADVAANGLEALEAVASKTYDLILMDMQMPEMDGIEATRLLRRTHPSSVLRIVALTANVLTQHREECLEAGMNAFLTKPLGIVPLQKVIEETVRWKRKRAKVRGPVQG